jgi:hypothetical protein
MLKSTWSDTNIQFGCMGINWKACKSAFYWNRAKLQWKYWNITWSGLSCLIEAAVVIAVTSGGKPDGQFATDAQFFEWQRRQDEERRKQLIKVICTVQGKHFEDEVNRNPTLFVTVKDVISSVEQLKVDIYINEVKIDFRR